jgi:hypothetical protein
MADLKVIFLIMLMINIGTLVVFKSGEFEDIVLQKVGNASMNNLGDFIVSAPSDIGATGSVAFSSVVRNVSKVAKPITSDSQTSTIIFRSDNPFAMILDLGLALLGTLVFGLVAVLIIAQAPAFVILLIGVPLTLIYIISAVMFWRSGN